jgi:membrane glycosyltransferase
MTISGQTSSDEGQAPLRAFEHVPAEMPIAMPEQDFGEHPRDFPHRPLNIDQWARRMLVVLLALLPASMAAHEMRRSIGLDGISLWEGVYLTLFIPLFAWIAFGFATSLIGFLILTMSKGAVAQPYRTSFATPLKGRTAILLPVCNEDFLGVMGRLSIMERSLAQVMGNERFEFFILSDSTPANGEIERKTYMEMRKGFSRPVHYRRRALNIGRKPGNIAEWVQRFGGGYERPDHGPLGARHGAASACRPDPDRPDDRWRIHFLRALATVRQPPLWPDLCSRHDMVGRVGRHVLGA